MKKYIKYIILTIFISLFIGIAQVSAIPVISASLDNNVIVLNNDITSATIDLSAINDNQTVNSSISNNIMDNNVVDNINDVDNSSSFSTIHIVGIVCACAILLGIIIYFVIKKR